MRGGEQLRVQGRALAAGPRQLQAGQVGSGTSFSHKLLSTDLQMCLNLSMFRDVVPASRLSSARSGGMLYMENNCVHGEK